MSSFLRLLSIFLISVVAMTATYVMGFATGMRADAESSPAVSRLRDIVAPAAGVEAPVAENSLGTQSGTSPIDQAQGSTDMNVFWEAWAHVRNEFYGDIPADEEITYSALRGSLRRLQDPFTSFSDPVVSEVNSATLDSEFDGIGAFVTSNEDGILMIQTPMAGQPAEKAGILAGDLVIKVDGEDITMLDTNEAVLKIRGPKGTAVVLTIIREGVGEELEFEVIRDTIAVPSVNNVKMLDEEGGPNIGYVQLTSFAIDTEKELQKALNELLEQGAESLVLDLRNNPGGYLNTAIDVASEFISEGIVVIQEDSNGDKQAEYARKGGIATDIPVVVLINGGSASASEIVAGAIRDHERGVIVGTTSFGKGSVQNVHDLSDGSELRVTVAVWKTPLENHIHKVGIEPDLEVLPNGERPPAENEESEDKSPDEEEAPEAEPTEPQLPVEVGEGEDPQDFQLKAAIEEALRLMGQP